MFDVTFADPARTGSSGIYQPQQSVAVSLGADYCPRNPVEYLFPRLKKQGLTVGIISF